jgi:hypothetical protein
MNIVPFAVTAGLIGAAVEYPLGNAFPLEKPVPIVNRMLVAGALVAGSVIIADILRRSSRQAKAQAHLDEMIGLIRETRTQVAMGDCRTALSKAGMAAVAAGKVESRLSSTNAEFQRKFSFHNEDRMASRDELAMKCFK